jgi:hypothetical protein
MRSYLENIHYKNGADTVAQGIGPEFKSQSCKKTKNPNLSSIVPDLFFKRQSTKARYYHLNVSTNDQKNNPA